MISFRSGSSGGPNSGHETLGVLARGGMGQVELAVRRHGAFRRVYAVKRLNLMYRNDAQFRAMFMEEARLAGMLRHANVVSVLDTGEDLRGPFLVMDFIEGITVAQLISWAGQTASPLPVQLAARIVRQAALGISAAHELVDATGQTLQLVHRDISPQNIIVGFDGCVRVTDFGIAKAFGRVHHSTTGLLKGKAGYMSPEQLRLERATQASDLFGLGVVLFELLSGRRLYAGRDALEVAQRVVSEPIPDIFAVRDDVHPALCELLFELLAKTPDQRPPSADDVACRLGWVVDELTALEGASHVNAFLDAHFESEKRRTKQLRQAAELGSKGPFDGLLPLEVADLPEATSPSRRKPFGAPLVGAAVVAAAAAWFFARGTVPTTIETSATVTTYPLPPDDRPSSAPGRVPEATTSTAPVAPTSVESEGAATAEHSEEASSEDANSEGPEQGGAASVTPAPRPRSSRRRRARPPRGSRSEMTLPRPEHNALATSAARAVEF